MLIKFAPGDNPRNANYIQRVVKIYSASSSLVRFENKNKHYDLYKRSSLLGTMLALKL
jgi:hypothetical protein